MRTETKMSCIQSISFDENQFYSLILSGRRVYLGERYPSLYFTAREAGCMMQLILGKTIKETARILKISPNTVQKYLVNMRRKTSSHSKSELITNMLASDFLINFLNHS